MKSGLLWYDADPKKPIWAKIDEAAQRYYEKFGVRPNTCFVNPSALAEKPALHGPGEEPKVKPKEKTPLKETSKLRVSAKPTILPNHIWLGISDN